MNEIEKMYWDSLEKYLSTFKFDTFLFNNKPVSVQYSNFSDGTDYGDDFIYPMSIDIEPKNDYIDYDVGFENFPISIMFGDCLRWECKIGNYEPDFIIQIAEDHILNFAIEIDGFDYHDKTKEQAARDKQRDRYFISNGYIPIRFAGTEVYRNALECVRETMQIIIDYISIVKQRDWNMIYYGEYQAEEKSREEA